MKKRALVGILWFYAAWYAANVLADVTNFPDTWGLPVGVAVGVVAVTLWHTRPGHPARPREVPVDVAAAAKPG